MSVDGNAIRYREFLSSVAELLRAMGSVPTARADRDAPAADGAGRPALAADPQLAALLVETSLVLATSGVRFWAGAVEAFAKALPSIEAGFGKTGEDPARAAAARAAVIDELRAGLRSLTSLSYQESRRALAELDEVAQSVYPPTPSEGTGEYWRRWTVKP